MSLQKSRGLQFAAFAAVALVAVSLVYAGLRRAGAKHAPLDPDLLSQIPPGAPTLVYINLDAIRHSSFYQHRPNNAPLTMPDRDYANFVQATGFNFEKDLDQVALASWPKSSPTDQQKTVVLADGRFNREKIREYAKQNGTVGQEQGHEVFRFPAKASGGWNSLTFLDDHRIALVDGLSIAQVLAPPAKAAAGDPVREQAARMDGAAVFAVSRVPLIPDNLSPGGIKSSQLAGLMQSLRMVTLAARPEGENFRVSLEGECLTDTDARRIQSALSVLQMIVEASLESPKTRERMDAATLGVLDNMLKSADITASAERVRILIELTPDVLKLRELQKPQKPK
jgi:hypothetical protein